MGCQLTPFIKHRFTPGRNRFAKFEDEDNSNITAVEPSDENTSYILLLMVGVFFTFSTILQTQSISYISVTESQVIFGTKAFFVLIMSIGILQTKFEYMELLSICLSFIGLLLFSIPNDAYIDEIEQQPDYDQIMLFDYLGIDLHPEAKNKAKVTYDENEELLNNLKGIICSLVAALLAGLSVVLTKKISMNNTESNDIKTDQIIMSN